MEILIVGCGRVGANLADILIDNGEAVSIIEQNPDNLLNAEHLDCSKLEGMPLDINVLEKAGISNVDAVLCISDNENMNVMVGQMAMKLFDVRHVAVRIFNPANEAAYQALGLRTICSTTMTIESVLAFLGFSQTSDQTNILGFPVRYDLREVTESWIGVSVAEVEKQLKLHVAAVIEDEALRLVSRDYHFAGGEQVVLLSLPEEDGADE